MPSPTPPKKGLPAWKKAAFALLATVLVFALLEGLLALCGVRPGLVEADRYVGFAAGVPLFVERSEGEGGPYLATAENKLPWFNHQRFAKRKPRGAYRIFSLGGSTTYGHPYTDAASFSGWLRELLPVADPGHPWEVINAGGISYASYRVVRVMEELTRYEPDLFIVYSGHNEFLERRTYKHLFDAPGGLIDAAAVLSRTRLYTVLRSGITALSGGETRKRTGPTQLQGEVNTLLENSIGPRDYARDDAQRERIFEHFRYNLGRMVDIAASARARILFITPASNLKDCSPFKSEHSGGLAAAQLKRSDLLLARGRELRAGGRLTEALDVLAEAERIDRRYADLHYLRGVVLHELKDFEKSREAFGQALDEDICPLRAPNAIRRIVTDVARERGVPLIDFASWIEKRSPHGIPGADVFLDHVHLTIDGYRLLALEIVDELARQGILAKGEGWNEEAIAAVSRRIEGRLDTRAHGLALRNLSQVYSWAGKTEEGERMARRAAELLGDDAETYRLLGMAATNRGAPEEAEGHFRRALELDPKSADAQVNLGRALRAQDRTEEARSAYLRALELEPDSVAARFNLAGICRSEGELEQAAAHYRRLLQIDDNDAGAHLGLGMTLELKNDVDGAMRSFRRALEIWPGYPEAHYRLGLALQLQDQPKEAASHFQMTLESAPHHAEAHYRLGITFHGQGDLAQASEHYHEAMELAPDHAQARYNLAVLLQGAGKLEDAERHYREVLRLDPASAESCFNLGLLLQHQGKLEEAIGYFRQALALRPEYFKAHGALGKALMAQGRESEALRHLREAERLRSRENPGRG